MQFTWLTDIHLNFLDFEKCKAFYQKIVEVNKDAILISGDIAEADTVESILCEMADHIQKPIYFVLGNHDYYGSSVYKVREAMTALTSRHELLFWLPAAGMQQLGSDTILVGQDGWADGRLGDYHNSRVSLNDSRLILDLFQAKILGKYELLKKMQELADADAVALERDLLQAINQRPKKIIILTHVPPFKESACHNGKISDDNWLPYFGSKIAGDVLLKIASKFLETDFIVLCGHTHSKTQYNPLKNLVIIAGLADYFRPVLQKNFDCLFE